MEKKRVSSLIGKVGCIVNKSTVLFVHWNSLTMLLILSFFFFCCWLFSFSVWTIFDFLSNAQLICRSCARSVLPIGNFGRNQQHWLNLEFFIFFKQESHYKYQLDKSGEDQKRRIWKRREHKIKKGINIFKRNQNEKKQTRNGWRERDAAANAASIGFGKLTNDRPSATTRKRGVTATCSLRNHLIHIDINK